MAHKIEVNRHPADTDELRRAFNVEFLSGPADHEFDPDDDLTISELLEEFGSRLKVLERRGIMPPSDADIQYEDATEWLAERGYEERLATR